MRRFTAIAVLVAAFLTLLALPITSAGQSSNPVGDLLGGVNQTLNTVGESLRKTLTPATPAQPQPGLNGSSPGAPGGYNPPLHGTTPHGGGSVATVDLPASPGRPLGGDPAGTGNELVVVGRSKAEQQADGTYHSHITIASVPALHLEIGVDAKQGQSVNGPLDPVQKTILDGLCNLTAQSVCLTVLKADASATDHSASTDFAVANAQLFGLTGVGASAASSTGSVSTDTSCQTSTGNSNVADASLITLIHANAVSAGSNGRACSDGSQSQTSTGNVVNLNEIGVPLPLAADCGAGVLNATGLIPGLAEVVCNADEKNGTQAGQTYGVREGLNAFVLSTLLKASTGTAETRAVAPPATGGGGGGANGGGGNGGGGNGGNGNGGGGGTKGGGGSGGNGNGNGNGNGGTQCSDGVDNDGDGLVDFPSDPGCSSSADDSEAGNGKPQCSDGIDNDGDGKVDFPADPQCSSAADDSEADQALAFTGTNLLWTVLLGAVVLLLGLRLREVTGRTRRLPLR